MNKVLRFASLAALLSALVLPVCAQIRPYFPTGGSGVQPSHEAHIFTKGRALAFPADERLDLPGGEGTIEFWFKRGWVKDLAGKNEYVCVIANGRAMIDDDAGGKERYRTRYAVYLNEEVLAVQVGDKLSTVSLTGSSGQEIVPENGFVHVALIFFSDDSIQPIIAGNVAPPIVDMPLGDVFGSQVTVGSIGAGRGEFPANGKTLKPVESEVHDYEGELARVRVWSSAFSDRFFTDGTGGPGILPGLSDGQIRRGLRIPSLVDDDITAGNAGYEQPALSDLVGRSEFAGDKAYHRMALASPTAGSWIPSSFDGPMPAQFSTPLVPHSGDMALPPLVTVVATPRADTVLVYVDGRYMGTVRFEGGGPSGAFLPGPGNREIPAAKVRRFKEGMDYLEFQFESAEGLEIFADPRSGALRRVSFIRPDLFSGRGELVGPDNDFFAIPNIQEYTKAAARSYDVTQMDPINLTFGATGTSGDVFRDPGDGDWLWGKGNSGVAAPRWFHVVPIQEGDARSKATTVTSSEELRTALSSRMGATVGVPGRVGVGFDMSLNHEQFRSEGRTEATTIGVASGASHALVVDRAQLPLSEEFVRAVRQLRAEVLDEDLVGQVEIDEAGNKLSLEAEPATMAWFIEEWGTHYVAAVTYGQLLMSVTTLSQEEVQEARKTGFDFSFETRTSADPISPASNGATEPFGPRGGFGIQSESMWKRLESEEFTKVYSFPPGILTVDPRAGSVTADKSVPILLDLRPLHELLSPAYFDDPRIYHDVRERLRRKIMAYIDRPANEEKHWASGPTQAGPTQASVYLRPVSMRAENLDDGITDDEGEYFGRLEVTPKYRPSSAAAAEAVTDASAEPRPRAPCDADYLGPVPEQPSVPQSVWWEAKEGVETVLHDGRTTSWADIDGTQIEGDQVYTVRLPAVSGRDGTDSRLQRVSLDDLCFHVKWSALEGVPDITIKGTEDDQLWAYWDGKGTAQGRPGSNYLFRDDDGNVAIDNQDEEGLGYGRWLVLAEELRHAQDDYDWGKVDDEWRLNPPRATEDNPRILRFVMREYSSPPFEQYFEKSFIETVATFSPTIRWRRSDSSKAEYGAQGLALTVEGWIDDGFDLDFFPEVEAIAEYTRIAEAARPKPTPRAPKPPTPAERIPFNHPDLVGHFPLDFDGRDLTGRAVPLADPIPPSRLFDGGLLFSDPYLGRQGTFTELPIYDPVFVVPAITDGSFTVRISFRARTQQATGMTGELLASLPLLVRGDGAFTITNEALASPGAANYSALLSAGPNRVSPLIVEPMPRSPVWATVTVAVDLENKQLRYRFDTTLPSYMNFLPEQARAATAVRRLAPNYDPGTSTEWYLSSAGPSGEVRYGADAVDEIMFFDRALSLDDMAALPKRSVPGTNDRSKAAAIHVASMYRHAARLLELDGVRISPEQWQEVKEKISNKTSLAWRIEGEYVEADGVTFGSNEFKDLSEDAARALVKNSGIDDKFLKCVGSAQQRWCDDELNSGPAAEAIRSYAGKPVAAWRITPGSTIYVEDDGNGKFDDDEFMQFPETVRLLVAGVTGGDFEERLMPFARAADVTLSFYLENAVLAADFNDDQRLDEEEAQVLLEALAEHYPLLGAGDAAPDLPTLNGAPIITWWRPVNESAQKRISAWLIDRLDEMGLENQVPIGVGRL